MDSTGNHNDGKPGLTDADRERLALATLKNRHRVGNLHDDLQPLVGIPGAVRLADGLPERWRHPDLEGRPLTLVRLLKQRAWLQYGPSWWEMTTGPSWTVEPMEGGAEC